MSKTIKILSIFAVLTLLALAFVTPARAFDSRNGETVIIGKDEVIEDDLYINAATIVMDGTVKGDLIAFAQTITVNGVVEGDLMSAGQIVIINGEIKDDARIAGQILQVGSGAVIGDDLLAAGMSLEMQKGSQVGGDLVVGSGQVLVAGDVAEDVLAGTAAFELRGSVGGDVKAYVDATSEGESGPPMSMFVGQSPVAIPSVPAGLTIADSAKIGGNLEYSSTIDLPVPSDVIDGKVTRVEPQIDAEHLVVLQPTPSQEVGVWALGMLRLAVTLILLGLFLGWLFPKFMKVLPEQLQAKPWASLGWGAVAYAVFFFALLVVVLAMVLGGMVFGAFTLGGLAGTIIWVGIVALFAMLVGFVIVTSYLTKIVVGDMLGKWLLNRINPDADHKFWPMILGVIVLVLSIGILRFPLIPIGFLGWLANFATILCGLGALWLWGRERFAKPVISD